MNPLQKLQGAVLAQAAVHPSIVDRFSPAARQMLASLALVAVAAMGAVSNDAHANGNNPLNANNCANIGGMVMGAAGGLAGANSHSGNPVARGVAGIAGASLGALAGQYIGGRLCSDSPPPMQAAPPPPPRPNYGYQQMPQQPPQVVRVVYHDGPMPGTLAPLSQVEVSALDRRVEAVMHAEREWIKQVGVAERAHGTGGYHTKQQSAAIRTMATFEHERGQLFRSVAELSSARDVTKYQKIVAGVMSVPTDGSASYSELVQSEAILRARNPQYEASMRTMAMRAPSHRGPSM